MNKKIDFIRFSNRLDLIWVGVFIYTLVIGLLIQLVLLPYVVPEWHAGNGLLKGLDGLTFHKFAVELSQQIQRDGWSAWEPTPHGQFVSGVAAIFYVLIQPAPWSVLPFNALLNATTAICFVLLMETFGLKRSISFITALPFIFFPSTLLWNSQFHNENYSIPGVIFIFLGWATLLGRSDEALNRFGLRSVFLFGVGSYLLGVVRKQIMYGMLLLSLIVAVALFAGWLAAFIRKKIELTGLIRKSIRLAIALIAMSTFTLVNIGERNFSKLRGKEFQTRQIYNNPKPLKKVRWNYTPWLPRAIDDQLQVLADIRRVFVRAWANSGSGIDLDVRFNNAEELFAYVPRSLQISLFSPFPNIWFTEGKRVTGSAFRKAVVPETLFSYICLLGLPIFLYKKHNLAPVWVITYFCLGLLVVYAMTIPNVGSLYRFRYPYYMTLICMGFSTWVEMIAARYSPGAARQG